MNQKSDQNANDVIAAQSQLLQSALTPLLPKGTPYALVDFPNYTNVGDSAIWAGAMALLEKVSGSPPRFVCDHNNFDDAEFQQYHPDGPIFIIGGGNFGDLWLKHQNFREMLFRNYCGRQIVQLPQTLNFKDPTNAAKCAALIKAHGNVKIMVRDRNSVRIAREELGVEPQLLPDMAFGMGPLKERVSPTLSAFMLLREDTEKAEYDRAPLLGLPNSAYRDWLDEPADFVSSCELKTRFNAWGRKGATMAKGRAHLFEHLSRGRLDRGLRMLSTGRGVITDRLHAHILCTLLNKPHVVLDNNYGKIFSYIDAWTYAYRDVKKASSAEEAIAIFRGWNLR
jgi:exopolysaccharide biosynthesis predicted pyruvyltransferase EpsI